MPIIVLFIILKLYGCCTGKRHFHFLVLDMVIRRYTITVISSELPSGGGLYFLRKSITPGVTQT